MKTSCEIIKDILPLYHDNVCSEESRALVEEHLMECTSCGELLKIISDELAHPVNAIDEAKPFKVMQSKIKKIKLKSFLKGAAIVFISFYAFTIAISWLTQPRWPIPSEQLIVSDVGQLADGRIVFDLIIDCDRNLYRFGWSVGRDGSCYYRINRTKFIRGNTNDFDPEVGLELEFRYVVDLVELNASRASRSRVEAITSFNIGTRNDAILVWEEGMELPIVELGSDRSTMHIPHK